MKSVIRQLITIISAIVLTLCPSTLVFAETIQQPDTYSIDSIEGYRHYLTLNDQLYLVKYSINYTTLPTTSATNTYIIRLMNGTTELGATSPYAYHTSGYGQGVAVIYFPSNNSTPTWSGNYTVRLEGNPIYSWNGTTPLTSSSSFAKWSTSTTVSDTSVELGTRIMYLAGTAQLTTAWSLALTQLVTGSTVLSGEGEAYFENVFPSLRVACPQIFAQVSTTPKADTRTGNTSAATASDSRLLGTPLDTTGIATFLHVSVAWSNAICWGGFWLAMTGALVWKMQATRVALFVFGFAMIGGAITGFMGMIAGILVGVIGALAVVFGLLWNR